MMAEIRCVWMGSVPSPPWATDVAVALFAENDARDKGIWGVAYRDAQDAIMSAIVSGRLPIAMPTSEFEASIVERIGPFDSMSSAKRNSEVTFRFGLDYFVKDGFDRVVFGNGNIDESYFARFANRHGGVAMNWQREMCGEVCRMDDRIAVVDDQGGWDVFDLSMNRLDGGEETDIETAKTRCEAWSKTSMRKRSIYYYTGDPMLDDLEFTSDDESEWASDPSYSTGWWVPNVTLTVQSGDGGETWDWVVEDRNTYPPTHLIGQGFPDIAAALIDFKRSVQGRFGHIASRNSRAGSKEARARRGHVRRCGKRASYGDYAWEDVTNFDNAWLANGVARNGKVPVFVECAEAGNGIVCLCEYDAGLWYWVFEDDSLAGDSAYVSTGPFMSRDNALSDFEFVREHSQEELHFDGYEPHWGSKNASSFDDDVYENPAKFPNFQESPAGGAISWMSELASGQVLEVWSSDDHHGWVLYDGNGSVLKENMFDGAEYDVDVLIENMCDDFFDPNSTSIAKRSQNFANSPRVPEEVDSKDDQPCPLCGSDHFDGKHCQTCGYDQSPDGLDDIDIDDLDEIEDVGSETSEISDGADDANQQVSAMAKSAEIETWWTPGASDRVSISTYDNGEISIRTNQPYVWGDYANAYHRLSMGDNEFEIYIDKDYSLSHGTEHVKMMTSLVGPPHYDDIVEELLKINESLRDTRSIDRT